jgi:hypothetical protein
MDCRGYNNIFNVNFKNCGFSVHDWCIFVINLCRLIIIICTFTQPPSLPSSSHFHGIIYGDNHSDKWRRGPDRPQNYALKILAGVLEAERCPQKGPSTELSVDGRLRHILRPHGYLTILPAQIQLSPVFVLASGQIEQLVVPTRPPRVVVSLLNRVEATGSPDDAPASCLLTFKEFSCGWQPLRGV